MHQSETRLKGVKVIYISVLISVTRLLDLNVRFPLKHIIIHFVSKQFGTAEITQSYLSATEA